MSYILDALKKSEQERGNGNIPGVQTVHTSSLNYNNKKTYWPYILIAAVLLNLVAIIYFVFDKESQNTVEAIATTDQISTENISAPATTTEQVQVENKQTVPAAVTEKPITPNTAVKPSSEEHTSPATSKEFTINNTVVEFYDLPEHIKQQIPKVIISAHVYSSNPAQRSIVINNNFMEEGEYVLDDLVLYEITRDGAIFSYHETLFHRGIINAWQ